MEKRKRGRPRKNVEPPVASTDPVDSARKNSPVNTTKAMQQIRAALDSLAFARDFASTIETGNESPHDFEELAGEVRKSICEAGEQMEKGLCRLGLLPEGAQGWFVPELHSALA